VSKKLISTPQRTLLKNQVQAPQGIRAGTPALPVAGILDSRNLHSRRHSHNPGDTSPLSRQFTNFTIFSTFLHIFQNFSKIQINERYSQRVRQRVYGRCTAEKVMSRRGVRPQRGTHHTLVSDRSCCFYEPRPHHPPWPRLQRLSVRLARLVCARDAAAGRLGARAAGLLSRGAGMASAGCGACCWERN
jgi:hypothetical protein